MRSGKLVLLPASTGRRLKQKFSVLERMICNGEDEGYPTDNRHLLMLASVKADLWSMNYRD